MTKIAPPVKRTVATLFIIALSFYFGFVLLLVMRAGDGGVL